MNQNLKSLLAVTLFVISLFLGTNVMVSKESNTSWLMWAFLFFAGAVLFWLWVMKEERSAQEVAEDAAESAHDRLNQLDAAKRRIEIKADAPVASVQEVVVKASGATEKPVVVEQPVVQASEPDDLTRIEGIGPKFAEMLQSAGITTFAQLADLTAERIIEIIRSAGGRKAASMETWAEQAKLAAAGDWDALAKLQQELSGGKRQ
jgi:predicted flap endonuclease-1-like 5' DNA nuclease